MFRWRPGKEPKRRAKKLINYQLPARQHYIDQQVKESRMEEITLPGRRRAFMNKLRRPWDGPDGLDFENWRREQLGLKPVGYKIDKKKVRQEQLQRRQEALEKQLASLMKLRVKKGAEAREHFTKVEEIKREIGKIGEEVEILGFDDSDDSEEESVDWSSDSSIEDKEEMRTGEYEDERPEPAVVEGQLDGSESSSESSTSEESFEADESAFAFEEKRTKEDQYKKPKWKVW